MIVPTCVIAIIILVFQVDAEYPICTLQDAKDSTSFVSCEVISVAPYIENGTIVKVKGKPANDLRGVQRYAKGKVVLNGDKLTNVFCELYTGDTFWIGSKVLIQKMSGGEPCILGTIKDEYAHHFEPVMMNMMGKKFDLSF